MKLMLSKSRAVMTLTEHFLLKAFILLLYIFDELYDQNKYCEKFNLKAHISIPYLKDL